MRVHSWTLSLLAATALVGPVCMGEDLAVPQAPAAAERPARGMTMQRVEARYGQPASREAAVGEPPISRWQYPGFVVYFEHDRVIHAVATG